MICDVWMWSKVGLHVHDFFRKQEKQASVGVFNILCGDENGSMKYTRVSRIFAGIKRKSSQEQECITRISVMGRHEAKSAILIILEVLINHVLMSMMSSEADRDNT